MTCPLCGKIMSKGAYGHFCIPCAYSIRTKPPPRPAGKRLVDIRRVRGARGSNRCKRGSQRDRHDILHNEDPYR
jgi:hypothetical protein